MYHAPFDPIAAEPTELCFLLNAQEVIILLHPVVVVPQDLYLLPPAGKVTCRVPVLYR